MTGVQDEYQRLVEAMTPLQRLERAADLLRWSREITAQRLIQQMGPMSPDRLKWQVALQHYGHQPIMRRLIEKAMASVSD